MPADRAYDLELLMANPRTEDAQAWEHHLLVQALRQLRATYQDYNLALFSGRLFPAQICLSESATQLGAWKPESRVIEISERLFEQPWGDVLEVLKHEMAHQYVHEVEQVHDETAHGPTFQRVCAERGIDARAVGQVLGDIAAETYSPAQQAIFKRIEHLLALGQSDNQHEAESAMRAARRLMLKHNIEASLQTSARGYSYRHLGKPTGRRMAWQRMLGNILSAHFFVEVIIVPVYRAREGKKGSVLEACGTPANLEIAAYVHDFLENTALQLWESHKRSLGISSDRDKQSYLAGVMRGFLLKLEQEAVKSQQEGLVWVGDPRLRQFYRARHPHTRSVSGNGTVKKDAFSAGQEAGRRIVLHRGVDAGSNKGAPRLLGSGGKA